MVRSTTFPAVLSLVLAGCAVSPNPLTHDDLQSIVSSDRQSIEEGVTNLDGPVSLEEAIARALKHNLDHRVSLLEQSLASGQLKAGRFDMLPQLLSSAGYSWRDKDNTRKSATDPNPTANTENSRPTANLEFSWNVLDFGVSYYSSVQNADRVLIASERRRKAMHHLIQSVRTTYWRALASQALSDQVRATIKSAEVALADSRRINAAQLQNPMEPLRFQRNLLENLRLLENVDRELAAAEIELAALIGVRPDTRIELVPLAMREVSKPNLHIEEMEEVALLNNPDLRESIYDARIAATETRRALVRLFPNLSFDYALRYDGDRFLVNSNWNEAATKVGFNLFNLLSGPANIRAAERDVAVAEARRMAMQMAVLSQVHLARHQYEDAVLQYQRSLAIHDVDTQLAQLARSQEAAQLGGGLERIASDVTEILSALRLYHALARVNETASRVQATLGLDPVSGSLDELSLEELTVQIGQALMEWK